MMARSKAISRTSVPMPSPGITATFQVLVALLNERRPSVRSIFRIETLKVSRGSL